MTLLESLQDIGKGRIIDNGCEYELIALAKGNYTFTTRNYSGEEKDFSFTLDGRQGENAKMIQCLWEAYLRRNASPLLHDKIVKAEYRKAGKR